MRYEHTMPERGTRRQGTHAFAAAALLAVCLWALGAQPASAANTDKDIERYGACLRQIGEDAQKALRTGEAWRGQGGGAPALHCVALALAALGQHAEAAVKLESLADNLANERPELVPDVLAQAAQSWARAGRPERAMKALDRALLQKPSDADLLLDRAVLHIDPAGREAASAPAKPGAAKSATKPPPAKTKPGPPADAKGKNTPVQPTAGPPIDQARLTAALEDLDRALAASPTRDDVLTLRATIRRKLARQAEARADADKAVALNPRNADAWLERGILRHLGGDEEGAGQDWRQALVADPDSAAARSAAANLAQLRPTPQ
ncbi:MAG: hypothetical protein ACKVSF_04885 [Alphaproteobacteria bacterium]